MNELTFQTKIVKSAGFFGGYARKLAHKFAIGVPDLLIHVPQFAPFLVECKWIGDPIPNMDRVVATTPRQLLELDRINKPNAEIGNTTGVLIGFKMDNKFCLKALNPTQHRITLKGGLNDPEVQIASGGFFDVPHIAQLLNILKITEK